MRGEGVQPSRSVEDLREADARLMALTAGDSLAEAAALTAGWSRRHLIDVALTLAVWVRRSM